MKTIFISGMFRSGTTFLAKLINANNQIVCASDPYAPIFKFFRNKLISKKKLDKYNKNSPLSDYYFNETEIKLFNEIQNLDLKIKISKNELYDLKKEIINHAKKYCPYLLSGIQKFKSRNLNDLINESFELINLNNNSKNKYIGIKEVWVNEFVPSIIKSRKSSKILLVIRDPRSIVASNYNSNDRYPILFLCRQWRKLASLAMLYDKKYKSVKIVKYENLIQNPNIELRKICKFLKVKFDHQMFETNRLIDSFGNKWKQNSSYRIKKNSSDFNNEMIDKWKSTLSPKIVKYVEFFCFHEMKKYGYKIKNNILKKTHINHKELVKLEKPNKYASWIKKYSKYNYLNELQNELFRYEIMRKKIKINSKEKKLFFLKNEIFNILNSK